MGSKSDLALLGQDSYTVAEERGEAATVRAARVKPEDSLLRREAPPAGSVWRFASIGSEWRIPGPPGGEQGTKTLNVDHNRPFALPTGFVAPSQGYAPVLAAALRDCRETA
jgi:hypothetical protein